MKLQQYSLLRHPSLSLKLLIFPAVLIVALGMMSLLAVYGLNQQQTAFDAAHNISLERATRVNEFIAVGSQIQSDLFQLSVLHFMDLPEEEIQPVRRRLERGLSDLNIIYGQILTRWPLDETERTLLEQMEDPLDAFYRQVGQAATIVSENPSFGVLLVRSSTPSFAELRAAQQAFLEYQQASFVQAERQAQQRATHIRLLTITITFLVALVGVFTTTAISTRLISGPIRDITGLMGRLAKGDLAVEVGDLERQDEIGAMARAVEVLRRNAIEKAQVEQALRESEELFRKAFDTELVAMAISHRQDGTYLEANPGFLKITGYTYEEMVGHTSQELSFLSPSQRHSLIATLEKEGRSYNQELTFPTKSGSWRTILFSIGSLIVNNEDCLLATMVDITERKQAEQALREQQANLSALIENTDSSIWSVDRNYCFIAGNSVFLQDISRVSDRPLAVGDTVLSDHFPQAVVDEWRAYYDRALSGERFNIELQRYFTDQIQWMEYRFSPIQVDEKGIIGVTVLGRDITERKQTERKIQQLNEEQRVLLELMPVAVTITNDTGRIIQANRMSEQLLGITQTEHTQRRYDGPEWDIIRPDGSPMPAEEYASVRALQEQRLIRNVEMGVVKPDDAITWISVSAGPIPLEGYGVAIAYADITDRKRAEEALQKNRALLAEAERLAQVGAWEWDIATSTFTCSEQWQRIHGVEQSAFLTETLLPIAHPDDRDLIRAAWQAALDEDKPYDIEHRIIRQDDGRERVVQAYGEVIRNGAGQPVTMYGAAQDITARKQTEESLRRSTERLQTLHQIDRAVLAAESPEVIAQAALRHLHRLVPYHQASVVEIDLAAGTGRELFIADETKIASPPTGAVALERAGAAIEILKQGQIHLVPDLTALAEPSPLEQRLLAAGLLSYLSLPLLIQEELIGALNLASDKPDFFSLDHIEMADEIANSLAIAIQHARLYEQARRDAQTKAMLLQEVNHRVGNNLLAILGILSLEKQRARQGGSIPASVLEDIYARIDSIGAVHRMLSATQWEPLDLTDLVTRIIEAALGGSPIRDQIQVTVNSPETKRVYLTPKQSTILALIINELTTNSIKHAFQKREAGYLQVQVSIADEPTEAPARPKIQLLFRDDGPGWPEQVLAGKRQNVGLKLIRLNVTGALNGQITLRNNNGAVALITFQPALF